MTTTPAAATVRTPVWLAALVATLAAVAFVYYPLMEYSVLLWVKKPEYSHGFFVLPFSLFLAWRSRADAPRVLRWPEAWGLAFVVGAAAVFLVAGRTNLAKEWFQGLALVLTLTGVTLLLGGWAAVRWLWPSLAFLLFMFPLPGKVEYALGWQLQKVATIASTFLLQTAGYPAYAQGVVIHVYDQKLEVANACSGLSMLLTFLALAAGMAILAARPWLDRGLILASAVPVAVVSNVVRIVLTGVLYVEGGKELGDKVFHDLAGWLMMPFALGLIWVELKLLDWVLVADRAQASREEVIRANSANPSYLFMANNPALTPTRPPAGGGR